MNEYKYRPRGKGHLWAGGFLLLVGVLLLARNMGVPFPRWFFTWPMILVAFGLFIGIQHRFRNPGWMFPVLIGGIFLLDQVLPSFNLRPFIAPIIIIALGLMFLLRAGRCRSRYWHKADAGTQAAFIAEEAGITGQPDPAGPTDPAAADRRDFIDTTAVFGGVKKHVLSKNFQGGEIVNCMGGSEINLTQADFRGRITIDATNIFGGTKLIVPPDWDIQSEVVAIFGGVDDKRQFNGRPVDHNKLLVIDGTCLFGGIEIRSF